MEGRVRCVCRAGLQRIEKQVLGSDRASGSGCDSMFGVQNFSFT